MATVEKETEDHAQSTDRLANRMDAALYAQCDHSSALKSQSSKWAWENRNQLRATKADMII